MLKSSAAATHFGVALVCSALRCSWSASAITCRSCSGCGGTRGVEGGRPGARRKPCSRFAHVDVALLLLAIGFLAIVSMVFKVGPFGQETCREARPVLELAVISREPMTCLFQRYP